MQEAIKNFALDRISGHRTVMTFTPEIPDVRVVAQNNQPPPPKKPTDLNKARDKKQTMKMVGIAVVVAVLLIMAIRAKWIKL